MSAAASYARFIAERAQPPPRTCGVTRHWDGRDVASQGLGLPPVSDPVAYAAVPAKAQPGLERRASPPMPMRPLRLIPVLPTPVIDWATEAAGLTFYLHPDLLLASLYDGVPAATGALLWVYREGQVACLTSSVHPALLVQTASASLPVACVELVPHLYRVFRPNPKP
jgi:hypothetical protein